MNSILIHAWMVTKHDEKYYLPHTHAVYLREICKYYSEICLLSPVVKQMGAFDPGALICLDIFPSVKVCGLPPARSYIGAVPGFFSYVRAYRSLSQRYLVSYVRYPTPFGWLQRVFFRGVRIVHFVGDPIDTIKHNVKLSRVKKLLYSFGFAPEHLLYLWATRAADRVYSNGPHIAMKLSKSNIVATPLVSSTLTDDDFYEAEREGGVDRTHVLIYVGYLRKAKGVETVINAYDILRRSGKAVKLIVVGSGESEAELKAFVSERGLHGVSFVGHVDNRERLNSLLREADVFCFASVSEGSPRVILEAMANGLSVVSTRVGSLPYVFEDGEDISFADTNSPEDFAAKISNILSDKEYAKRLRSQAALKVRGMTTEKFIKDIFYDA